MACSDFVLLFQHSFHSSIFCVESKDVTLVITRAFVSQGAEIRQISTKFLSA
uniref:Uncharacterized protein n=1 Tax=Anguilla anguilla TaxID=7936 RepID=A0A0E9SQ24_ANGAN